MLERIAVHTRFDLAVAVQIEIGHAPALRRAHVARFLEDPSVDPTEGAAEDAVAVERFVRIVAELHVVSVETDVDLVKLPGRGSKYCTCRKLVGRGASFADGWSAQKAGWFSGRRKRDDIQTRPLLSIAAWFVMAGSNQ